jgi:hypothetical protein
MLADTVEATVRSLESPSATKIRTVVTEAIRKRLAEGELEECGLSIRDLARIRESFITTLLSIYHPRVQYPSDSGPGEIADAKGRERRGAQDTSHAPDHGSESRLSGGG